MKKVLLGTAILSMSLAASPAFALFTNGGFEDGTIDGWTVDYGSVRSDTHSPNWAVTESGQPLPQVIDNTYHGAGEYAATNIDPYNGSKMVKINGIDGNYHATKLSQTATLTADDIGDTLYVNWGAALVNPSGHPAYDQPFFKTLILKNGVVLDNFMLMVRMQQRLVLVGR